MPEPSFFISIVNLLIYKVFIFLKKSKVKCLCPDASRLLLSPFFPMLREEGLHFQKRCVRKEMFCLCKNDGLFQSQSFFLKNQIIPSAMASISNRVMGYP